MRAQNQDPEWTGVELSLAGLALALGADRHGGRLSAAEQQLASAATGLHPPSDPEVRRLTEAIRDGDDPLA